MGLHIVANFHGHLSPSGFSVRALIRLDGFLRDLTWWVDLSLSRVVCSMRPISFLIPANSPVEIPADTSLDDEEGGNV